MKIGDWCLVSRLNHLTKRRHYVIDASCIRSCGLLGVRGVWVVVPHAGYVFIVHKTKKGDI
jgi:hypothetical protein